ncbi:site-specific DNA-methyltransferase [Anaerotruncus colihominis]|jgi:DNA modification methylase|uniref:site-specific DNA-methyltransferase n=1 Tax=Anaerotruncus colihominis TaxID=169435 RepID=UPI003515EAA0
MSDYQTEAEPKAWADGVPVFCAHDAIVDVAKLVPNPKNPNQHPDSQIQLLGRIIRQTGWRQPITVSKRSGFIVKGHGRLSAALLEGIKEAPVDYQNYTNDAEEYADLVADNRIAELAETDNRLLADIFAEIDTGEIPMELTGYTEDEVESLVTALSEALHNDLHEPDDIPEPPEPDQTVTQKGDLWILGRHRVVCGSSTNAADMGLLLDGAHPEILLTDPPYCSGGFQESGRSSGSIGTKRYDKDGKEIAVTIANDTLSTRGYQSLMREVLQNFDGLVAYIFTDWRMWVYLFDIVETAGLGVKNMLVWNKKSPGMGMGWRTQHELVMFAHRTKPKWDNHKGYGNVLEATRSGNELHPTQKPVEILEKLLDNTDWAKGVLDTFGGSGTTLIASESVGQASFIMEMDPRYVDVIVRRYIKTTGKTTGIRLIRKGKELAREQFEQMFAE